MNDRACQFPERCQARGSREFGPHIRQRLFRGPSLGDVGDNAFQFKVAGRAEVELSYRDDVQGRPVFMDDPVLVTEWGLGADRLRQRPLQIREVVGVYAVPECLERHRIEV